MKKNIFFLLMLFSSFTVFASEQQPAQQTPIVNPYPHIAYVLTIMLKLGKLKLSSDSADANGREHMLLLQSARTNIAAYSLTEARAYLEQVDDLFNPNKTQLSDAESFMKVVATVQDPFKTFREIMLKTDPQVSAKIAKLHAELKAQAELAALKKLEEEKELKAKKALEDKVQEKSGKQPNKGSIADLQKQRKTKPASLTSSATAASPAVKKIDE